MKQPYHALSTLLRSLAEFLDEATDEEAAALVDHLARVVSFHELRSAITPPDGAPVCLGYVEGLPAQLYFEGGCKKELLGSFFRAVDRYRWVLKQQGEYPECAP